MPGTKQARLDRATLQRARQFVATQVQGMDGVELAPERDLEITLHHDDGSEDAVRVCHSLNAEQIQWFRAGSALNLLREGAGRS